MYIYKYSIYICIYKYTILYIYYNDLAASGYPVRDAILPRPPVGRRIFFYIVKHGLNQNPPTIARSFYMLALWYWKNP